MLLIRVEFHVVKSFFFPLFYPFSLLLHFYFILELIYNVVLVSGVQQNDSVIHTHELFFFRFFSHIGYYRILNRGPCAIQ